MRGAGIVGRTLALLLARERLRSGTRLFSATVEELKQDREELRS